MATTAETGALRQAATVSFGCRIGYDLVERPIADTASKRIIDQRLKLVQICFAGLLDPD